MRHPFREAVSVKFLTDNAVGLYLHIPFCLKKCAYCDFYSSFVTEEMLNAYTDKLISELEKWGGLLCRPINTVYFGGGTPSLLKERLIPVLNSVRRAFELENGAEITLEINPSEDIDEILSFARTAGVNRLSIGVQSGNDTELRLLGRTHTAEAALFAVDSARSLGFDNISLDLMLGLPDSSLSTLECSLEFITSAKPEHISAYILKLEENTLLYKNREELSFPDDDMTAEQYLFMCRYLKKKGYRHYEISNFCREGMQSRHNLKYWNCEEYLGIGPSAHSFLEGKRFYYPRDLRAFLNGEIPKADGTGGTREEYLMLRLRLDDGLVFSDYRKKFGEDIPSEIKKNALLLKKAGLADINDRRLSLTDSGMLVSNSIIAELSEYL